MKLKVKLANGLNYILITENKEIKLIQSANSNPNIHFNWGILKHGIP
jgi:hypothetical protein